MVEWYGNTEFSELVGKTLVEINRKEDEIIFKTSEGDAYEMSHAQECCESVTIDDVCGELQDLIGSPILLAEEETNSEENPENVKVDIDYQESFTWTFYKLATVKANVTIRWYGDSNGYYSEAVDFRKMS